MKKIRTLLQGYKTYILAVGAIAGAIAKYADGTLNEESFAAAVVAALMACTLHARMER